MNWKKKVFVCCVAVLCTSAMLAVSTPQDAKSANQAVMEDPSTVLTSDPRASVVTEDTSEKQKKLQEMYKVTSAGLTDFGKDSRADATCPAGILFTQNPNGGSAANSDALGGYQVYDDFAGVSGDIETVRWWGINAYHDGTAWVSCTYTGAEDFEISFWNDDTGSPDLTAPVCIYTVSPVVTDTGELFAGSYTIWEYYVVLPTSCTMAAGWFSIYGLDNGTDVCWSMWHTSTDGNSSAKQWDNSIPGWAADQDEDMSVCLDGAYIPTYGACCNDYDGTCADNVEMLDCLAPLRFVEGVLCDDLVPPCGPTGACCDAGLNCLFTDVEAECDLVSGTWYEGEDCSTFTCPATCTHTITLLDDYGDGWNGGSVDVLVNGTPVLTGLTIDSGAGPESHTFDAATGDTITTAYTAGSWAYENCYYIYDVNLAQICSDGETGGDCGAFEPTGVTCTGNCGAVAEGACCMGDGTCTIGPMADCTGMYMGDGTTCEADTCKGACCAPDGSCTDTFEDDCADSFYGIGTDCATTTCPVVPPNDDCVNAEPIAEGTSVIVDNTVATDDAESAAICDTGSLNQAVWYSIEGIGKELTATTCNPGGDFNDTKLQVWCSGCAALMCVAGDDDDPDCGISTVRSTVVWCSEPGVTYYIAIGGYSSYMGLMELSVMAGDECTEYPNCTPPTGACCDDDYNCLVMSEVDCVASGGTYLGDDTVCDPNPCGTGACCYNDGYDCDDTGNEDNCLTVLNGVWMGYGLTCDDVVCVTPGDDCSNPYGVTLGLADLPFTDTNSTCGRQEHYEETCLGSYDSGDDMMYEFVITEAMNVMITLDPGTFTWTGFAIDTSCPPADPCLAYSTNSGSGPHTIGSLEDCLSLAAGTYYIMVDSWPTPQCIDFDLTIEECVVPTGACCHADGTCTIEEEANCADSYMGDDTVCDTNDCNANGLPDECEIAVGLVTDCDGNGIPDECELAGNDCDGNGVLDVCDPDCDGDGIVDACMIPGGELVGDCATVECAGAAAGTSLDCQEDSIPDECQLGGAKGECPDMVYDNGICDGANGTRPTVGWDDTGLVVDFTVPQGGNGMTFSCFHMEILDFAQVDMPEMRLRIYALPTNSIPTDLPSFAAATSLFDYTYTVASGELVIADRAECYPGALAWDYDGSGPSYTFASGSYAAFVNFPGSGAVNYWASAAQIGDLSYVWGVQADAPSVGTMDVAFNLMGGGAAAGGDCNSNGIPDECDVWPICDLGPPDCSLDCNSNFIPDECEVAELDCNENGIPDDCDIADCDGSLWCSDCNEDGIPDGCQLVDNDCNNDGIPDDCQLEGNDCNENGILDECDMADCDGSPWCDDCQPNGILDECELDAVSKDKDIVLDEGFEVSVPPADWTSVVTAGHTQAAQTTWFQGTSPFEGTYAAQCDYDPAFVQQDEWIVSPAFTMSGTITLAGQTMGSVYWGTPPEQGGTYDNYDIEAWVIIGAGINDGDDIFLGITDDFWVENWIWAAFSYEFASPGEFRIAFRYDGNDGAQGTLDAITLEGDLGPAAPPANDCNENGIPDDCELCGDYDYDADVDVDDYDMFLASFGAELGDAEYLACADFDDDGLVSLRDYQSWLACYRDYVGNPLAGPPTRLEIVPMNPMGDSTLDVGSTPSATLKRPAVKRTR